MLIEMFKYKQWSDLRTLDAIERIDEQKFPSASAFVAQQLNHMIIVEELFTARLLGNPDPHRSTNTETLPGLFEISQRIVDSNQWFSGYTESLKQQHLNQSVYFRFADGKQGSMTRLEILFHIINHGTYHKGAIGHALDLAHVSHPADTYTVFIHAAAPERRVWSGAE
ncbi:DinB family protein [Paraburkholderia caledonica]|uniref:DinB family protein n=1 Tax=Paraburkholderia caledonica TaxID=134536 RepID=UPI000DEF24A1|nr:DinB family protein [Paraburkholderia caledonica]AXF18950.1 damage-inducible protein DinB [Paraburkholderia caledonica]